MSKGLKLAIEEAPNKGASRQVCKYVYGLRFMVYGLWFEEYN